MINPVVLKVIRAPSVNLPVVNPNCFGFKNVGGSRKIAICLTLTCQLFWKKLITGK